MGVARPAGGGVGRGASRSLAGPLRDCARTMVTAMVVMVLLMVDGVGDDGRVGDGNDVGNRYRHGDHIIRTMIMTVLMLLVVMFYGSDDGNDDGNDDPMFQVLTMRIMISMVVTIAAMIVVAIA